MNQIGQAIREALTVWMRSNRLLMTMVAHALLFALSWFLAFGLAYNFSNFQFWFGTFFLRLLPIVVTIKLVVFAMRGLHRGSWRYVSMRDVSQVTIASWLGFAFIFALYYGVSNLRALGVNWNPFEG